jgi:AraC-like DNA-binding protein
MSGAAEVRTARPQRGSEFPGVRRRSDSTLFVEDRLRFRVAQERWPAGMDLLRDHFPRSLVLAILRGHGRFSTAGAAVSVGPGWVVHMPRGSTSRFVCQSACQIAVFATDDPDAVAFAERRLGSGPGAWPCQRMEQVLGLLRLVARAMDADGRSAIDFISRMEQGLYALLALDRAAAPEPHRMRLDEARIHLHEHLHAGVGIKDLARRLGVHRSRLSRWWVAAYGESPRQTLEQARVQRACGLLVDSDAGMADIAARCGLSDASAFIKWFRRSQGCTPQAWRAQRRQQRGSPPSA